MTNTLAYYDTAIITAINSFIVLAPDVHKNDVIQGAGQTGKNNINWGKLTALAGLPTKKVNKAELQTYLSTNIVGYKIR